LKNLLPAMQADFRYEIDKSRSDLCGLRYVTWDINIIIKDDVFPAILTESTEPAESKSRTIVPCGIDALDNILEKIEPVDWTPFQTSGRGDETRPPSEKVFILRTVEQILHTADNENTPIVNHTGVIYYFTGTHYKAVNEIELTNFLVEAASRCGVPSDTAIYQTFAEKIVKQIFINTARHNSRVSEPDTMFMNLQNGTLFFDKRGHRFEEHSPQRFIRYCLTFDYDSKATAPLWQRHLDRSLPILEKQQYLAECLALPFYQGKIEKAPIFYGQRDTGKSTTLDVYKALIGMENISTESLAALTQTDYHGDYARARLDGKVVNIASDVSKKIHDEGMTKTLISREAVSARNPNQKGFDMRNYARLVFAMNELPSQFFTDAALTKRAAIIEFDQQVAPQNKDTDFAEKIIADELPGILNWIIAGLDRLLKTGRLDPPPCCIAAMDKIRRESDPLAGWLEERQYHVGDSTSVSVKEAYADFREYCQENGNTPPAKRTFTRRLRDVGYKVALPPNHEEGVLLHFSTSFLKNDSVRSVDSVPLENKDEMPGTTTERPRNEKNGSVMVPPGNTVNSGTRNERNERNENSEHSFDSETTPEPPLIPSILPPEEHANLAAIIRQTLRREPPKNVVEFETDILPQFGGDRVPASAFLTAHGFDVVEGKVREKTENIAG
jgi:putative DNA primase/helicase